MIWSPQASFGDDAQPRPSPATASAPGQVFNITVANGANQVVLFLSPPHARGTLVMLPGGSGKIGVTPDGSVRHPDNFVVRTRATWAEHGYAVLIPDAVNGANLRGIRSTPDYAGVVGALVAFAHVRQAGPVFLLGTSQGSIAAMNGAAHAPAGTVAGLVLTESVSVLGGSHETVFDADPTGVHVPTLVVANEDDRCEVAPPGGAPRIAAALTRSPEVRVQLVSGGSLRSPDACGSLTPHGYYGIEGAVVNDIIGWLDSHP